ncbi:MAG: hypothetical protein V9F00_09250 [Nocardioides sp.]
MADHVNVVTSTEARLQLGTMLDRFRNGQTEPMFFGSHRKPEAVILSYADYTALIELADRWAEEDAFLAEMQRRATSEDRGTIMSVEEIAAQVGLSHLLDDQPAAAAANG